MDTQAEIEGTKDLYAEAARLRERFLSISRKYNAALQQRNADAPADQPTILNSKPKPADPL
jgi:hypothetical protein